MKLTIFLFSVLFFLNNAKGQERVYKIHQTTISNSSVTFQSDLRYTFQSANNPSNNPIAMSGNFNPNGSTFLVYTKQDVDTKFQNILDSLVKYKMDYNSNRKIDFDSLKIYFLEIQENIKKSIDNIPQIVTTTDVAKLLKAQIIQDLKETEISNLNTEIKDLKESIELLKLEIVELKKKKPNQ